MVGKFEQEARGSGATVFYLSLFRGGVPLVNAERAQARVRTRARRARSDPPYGHNPGDEEGGRAAVGERRERAVSRRLVTDRRAPETRSEDCRPGEPALQDSVALVGCFGPRNKVGPLRHEILTGGGKKKREGSS